MSKIEQIEKLLKQWKACKPPEEDVHGIISIKKCKGGVIALGQALAILKEPSNTRMHMDTKPCVACHKLKQENSWVRKYNFCHKCGKRL